MQDARITQRLTSGIELRIHCYRKDNEALFQSCVEWLERQRERAVAHFVALDEQQEGMIVGEIELFEKFATTTLRLALHNDYIFVRSQHSPRITQPALAWMIELEAPSKI